MKKKEKKPKGRPETRKIPHIDTTPEELARAIFRNATETCKPQEKSG